MNPGRDHKRDVGNVCFYGNAIYAELREWLLSRCPKVSLGWVMRKLKLKGNPGDASVDFKCADPDYPNLLNRANLIYNKTDRSYTLVGGRVINVGEFSGDVKVGCSLRFSLSLRSPFGSRI